MRRIHATLATALMLAGAALLGGLPAAQAQSFPRSAETPAAATQGYPRTYGSGENIMVDYGPVGQGMLVGGGRVMVSQTSGMNVDVVHLDAQFVQQPRQGYVPLTIGSGESQETVWVPQSMVDMFRRARTGGGR